MNAPALRAVAAVVLAAAISLVLSQARPTDATAADPARAASGWMTRMFVAGQPTCDVQFIAPNVATYWTRDDCGFGRVKVSNATSANNVQVELVAEDGAVLATQTASFASTNADWTYDITPKATWPAGAVKLRAKVDGEPAAGEFAFYLNALGAEVEAAPKAGGYAPGDPIHVTGTLFERDTDSILGGEVRAAVAGTFKLAVGDKVYGPFTANKGGTGEIDETIPGDATAGLKPATGKYTIPVTVKLANAAYTDPVSGATWATSSADAGLVTLSVPAPNGGVLLENSFVSAVGWVKPGESYPFRVFVRNTNAGAITDATVTLTAPDGASFTKVTPATGSGSASISGDTITWTIANVPAATAAGPGTATLVVEGQAASLAADPKIVWKDISSNAKLTFTGGPAAGVTSRSHGPKVIPPKATYETARYGDRPFPVIPVDYFDREHEDAGSASDLDEVINSPDNVGSTFNLYQEMSYGQLFPHGTVPSAGVAQAGWDVTWNGYRKEKGFQFSPLAPGGTCHGATFKDVAGTPLYGDRVKDGWYQLPGNTDFYGDDKFGTALVGAVAGVGLLMDIDSACGPTGKLVYDAAQIADPDIDYSDYDTDKDGVVDFFMTVFTGLGGNGDSQINGTPTYDNVWPHSSSLEFYFTDPATGLKGYISDDQLKDLEGRPMFYTDSSRTQMTTSTTAFPVYVRVGPYNVNPESAIEHASVISHEYGHSLGLPDYYSLGSRETYGDWMLMATDKSQNMDVNGKQELGWLVPRVLKPGQITVTGWRDSKQNTHRIDWIQPDGTPYTLEGPNVNNGEAYVAKLPNRQIVDKAKVETGTDKTKGLHIWWSQSGNDFGCTPEGGHDLDVALTPAASGAPISITFKSMWDIEWDYDYGFVMVSTDAGKTWQSLKSKKGYTTDSSFNPNANSCQTKYGNGITGTSTSHRDSTATADRLIGEYPDPVFVEDEYEFTPQAGQSVILRFSYATDPGLARPGWFVDDLKATQGGTTLFASDFEDDDAGDCAGAKGEAAELAPVCSDGWVHVDAAHGSDADHAYYMELRDRSGFDYDGHGENDRDPIGFLPGLLLVYTDEAHGYGNVGTDDPPAQTPLDSQPQAGNRAPDLNDAAFTAAAGKNAYSDSGAGHTDNYTDPNGEGGDLLSDPDWVLNFDCLTFQVLSMAGDDIGPAQAPWNLSGDVKFTLGPGCGAFDYGVGPETNGKPTVEAIAKPNPVEIHKKVTLDAQPGITTYDDRTAPTALTYEWDLDGDGTYEKTGSSLTTKFDEVGDRTVRLRVTDADGASATDTLVVHVIPNQPGNGGGGGGGSAGETSTTQPPAQQPAAEQPQQQPPASEQPPAQQPPAAAPQQPAAPPTAAPAPAPPVTGGVAGAQQTKVARSASGWGAISGRLGKSYFWLRATATVARLHWDDKAAGLHLRVTKAKARYAGKKLTVTGTALVKGKRVRYTLVLTDRGKRDLVVMTLSNGYRRSGTVVQGGLAVR